MKVRNKDKARTEDELKGSQIAGNGLLDRRLFLAGGLLAGSVAALPKVGHTDDIDESNTEAAISSMLRELDAKSGAQSISTYLPESMRKPGLSFRGYGKPADTENSVKRMVLQPYGDLAPGAGVAMTPLQSLEGSITPNGLHFERSHNGRPTINPDQHEFFIHGLVRQPLKFSMDALSRYPMISRAYFIECAGNSFFNSNLFSEPMQVSVGMLHGLVSGAEWTGIPLSVLLDEAGLLPEGKWLLAEGADSAGMSRSIPLKKAMHDTMIAIYQNGEMLRPEQGYPMRLLLPGFEGNMSVKWLRRLKVTQGPTYTKDETSKYTDLMPDGVARQFTYTMGVKSTITKPATGLVMDGPGVYEISGLAWSGSGRITRVEVSADGGKSWATAAMDSEPLPMALTRFRIPWKWDGLPTLLQSRATDEASNTQLRREIWSAQYAEGQLYHCNAIQTWGVARNGEVSNVFI